MDFSTVVSTLIQFIPFVSGIPSVAHVLTFVTLVLPALSFVVTYLVQIWHAAIAFFTGLASLPGCAWAAKVAAFLTADEAVVDADSNQVLSVIKQLSGAVIPKAPAAAAPAAAPAAAAPAAAATTTTPAPAAPAAPGA